MKQFLKFMAFVAVGSVILALFQFLFDAGTHWYWNVVKGTLLYFVYARWVGFPEDPEPRGLVGRFKYRESKREPTARKPVRVSTPGQTDRIP